MLNHPEEEEEPVTSKIYRASMNTFHRADIFCRKAERNAKLAVKKLQLQQVKKTFGVDYMTLLEKEADPDDLDRCMREGHEKMDVLHKDIRSLRAEKTSLDDLLKQKLLRKTSVVTETSTEVESEDMAQQTFSSQAEDDKIKETLTSNHEVSTAEAVDEKPSAGPSAVAAQSESVNIEDQEDEFVVLPPPSRDSERS